MNKDFLGKTQKLAWLIIILSVLGLIFMPLLPWFSVATGGLTQYFNEATIDAMASVGLTKVNEDLGLIGLSFWLALIFGIVAIIGGMVHKTARSPILSRIILITGCITILFAVLIIIGHWNFLNHIDELASATTSVSYGYNYIPLILGIALLISSIFYTVTVVLMSTRSPIRSPRPKQAAVRAPEQTTGTDIQSVEEKKSAPVQKTDAVPKFCPGCGAKLIDKSKFCPKCGAKL